MSIQTGVANTVFQKYGVDGIVKGYRNCVVSITDSTRRYKSSSGLTRFLPRELHSSGLLPVAIMLEKSFSRHGQSLAKNKA